MRTYHLELSLREAVAAHDDGLRLTMLGPVLLESLEVRLRILSQQARVDGLGARLLVGVVADEHIRMGADVRRDLK